MSDYPYGGWETPDIASLLARRDEDTTFANVGSYTVPLGTDPLRREIPVGARPVAPACDPGKFCTLDDWTSQLYGDDPLARRMY